MGRRISDEIRSKIAEDYLKGESSIQLSEKYGINKTTVCDILKEKGIKVRSYNFQPKYSFNEHYFDEIDTEEKAYFLGLYFADGCNLYERHEVSIELIEDDINLLEKLKTALESNRPLLRHTHEGRGKPTCQVIVLSRHFCDRLKELGCPPRKSLILQFPEYLKPELYLPFIRGYFDGDGGITIYNQKSSKRGHCTIVGSKDFIMGLKDFLEKNYPNIEFIIRNSLNDKVVSLVVYKKKSVFDFLEMIYSNANIYMERKFQKYQELLKQGG